MTQSRKSKNAVGGRRTDFADSDWGLTVALACDLTGERPKEVLNWPDIEIYTSAKLKARLMEEEYDALSQ